MPSLGEDLVRFLQRAEAAHAGADDDAAPLPERLVERKARIDDGHLCAGEAELDEEVVAADLLLVHELFGVEVLDLGRDARGEVLGVEAGDRTYAALSGDACLPGCFRSDADGRHEPDARDYDPPLHPLHRALRSPPEG
jgi:hypothetical protein